MKTATAPRPRGGFGLGALVSDVEPVTDPGDERPTATEGCRTALPTGVGRRRLDMRPQRLLLGGRVVPTEPGQDLLRGERLGQRLDALAQLIPDGHDFLRHRADRSQFAQ